MFLLNLQYSSLSNLRSLQEQISDSEFELPELPFRALRHGNKIYLIEIVDGRKYCDALRYNLETDLEDLI